MACRGAIEHPDKPDRHLFCYGCNEAPGRTDRRQWALRWGRGPVRTVTRSVRPREPERRSERLRAAPTAEGGRAQIVPDWFDIRGTETVAMGDRGYQRPGRLRSLPDGDGGVLRGQAGGPGAPPEIQTDACAGSSVRC